MTLLANKRALVVEDEAVVAIMIEDMLLDLGCDVVATEGKLRNALEKARSLDMDFGVLDVNLGGQMSYEVAQALLDRQIPFLFATGYGMAGLPERFSHLPVIQKPFAAMALHQALLDLMQTAET